jgi:hypothetical protein
MEQKKKKSTQKKISKYGERRRHVERHGSAKTHGDGKRAWRPSLHADE